MYRPFYHNSCPATLGGHQREFYDCMFKAAWATIDAFAAKKGLTSGMTAILHTWGSNLFYHPHIHCIVPGGGIDKHGVWHHIKGCKHSDFLFPVVAMSTKFRGKFMSLLTRRLKEKDIVIEKSVPKERKKRSYIEICNEKGWDIGICKDCRSALPLIRATRVLRKVSNSLFIHNTSKLTAYQSFNL